MIIQPIFPPFFVQLIKTIVSKQLSVYQAKQKISNQKASTLFDAIDYLKTGQIYLEDLYAYLKSKGLIISKRQLKFINRYFGFSNYQKLNFLLFKQKFLFTQQQNDQINQVRQDQQNLFVNLVRLTVDSYNEIQKLRSIVSLNINQLEECFQLYYTESPKAITKSILQQLLAIFGIYSRLNLFLLTKYIIGDENTEVNIRQLFWNANAIQQANTNSDESKSNVVKQMHTLNEQELYNTPSTTRNQKKVDILTQIQNIQVSIRFKYDKNTSRRDQEQKCPRKKDEEDVKLLDFRHRTSENNLSSYFTKEPTRINRSSKFKKNETTQFSSNKKQKDGLEQILRRSLESYEQKDPIQERQAQIQQLLKNKTKYKNREEVISRASSAAKLKIQEIQKRVFSKNKLFPSGIQPSAMRTPINLIINHQYRSRNTSIRKK